MKHSLASRGNTHLNSELVFKNSVLRKSAFALAFIAASLPLAASTPENTPNHSPEFSLTESFTNTGIGEYSRAGESLLDYTAAYSQAETQPPLLEMLYQHGGIFFGDNHTDPLAGYFMASQMQFFNNSGVETFYVELGYQSQTDLYNAFNARDPGADSAIESAIRERWEKYGAAESRIAMLYAAREAGINIVPIDIENRAAYPNSADLHLKWIEPIQNSRDHEHSFIIFAGSLHGATHNGEGIGQILDIPRITISQKSGALYSLFSFDGTTLLAPHDNTNNRMDFRLVHSVHPQQIVTEMEDRHVNTPQRRQQWTDLGHRLTALEQSYRNSLCTNQADEAEEGIYNMLAELRYGIFAQYPDRIADTIQELEALHC